MKWLKKILKKKRKESPHEVIRAFEKKILSNPFNVMSVEDFPSDKTYEGADLISKKNDGSK